MSRSTSTMLRRPTAGFSIVELMISITIGLILLAAMASLFGNATRAHRELINSAQESDNGSYAIATLAEDLRHAGYYGGAYSAQGVLPAALPDPCVVNSVPALAAGLVFPVQGYDAAGASPVSCIPATDFVAGTDVIVIRRASTIVTGLAALDPDDIYIQNNSDWTSPANPLVNIGAPANFTLLNKDGVTLADVRKYYVRIYYVSPCNLYAPGANGCTAAADGGTPSPTLRMRELGTSPVTGQLQMLDIPLAQGVENLQIDYGIDTDGDGVADNFVTTPAAVSDWGNVTEVDINMLVRNAQPTLGYTDDKTYTLGLAGPVSPGGPYKRHLFTQHVRLTNLAQSREAP
jgi:type IV pilus assembly protein PilW